MRHLLPILIALAVLGGVWVFDLPKQLGAHPWWSQNVILYGGPAGIVIAALLSLTPLNTWLRLVLALCITLAAFILARNGGLDFAASYAEDTAAGQRWFFGWIAAAGGLGGSVTALAQIFLPRDR